MAPSFIDRIWHPKPAPPDFGKGKQMPDAGANPLRILTFGWLTPLLSVGWSRPLEESDLWLMDEARSARRVADATESQFYARCPPFKRPQQYRPPEYRSAAPVTGSDSEEHAAKVAATQKKKYDMSLLKTLHNVFFWRIYTSGALRFTADTLNTTTPLVSKLIIAYITTAYIAHKAGPQAVEAGLVEAPRSVGYGIGLAFAIFAMQETASLCNGMFFYFSMTVGFLVRTSLVSVIFRKALRLSGKARQFHSTGQITTMISADCTRLDIAAGFFHMAWSSPIQIIIGVALLINNLGVSALVGLGVLLVSFPIQGLIVNRMIGARRKSLRMTDKRVRLLQEVLQGIRLLILFNWQGHYIERIAGLRRDELKNVRRFATLRGVLTALTAFVPILAATLTFITYSLTGHSLDPATIFSSLQLFNTIRAPLFFLPLVAAACSDGYVSLQRIAKMLMADELEDVYPIVDSAPTPDSASASEDDELMKEKKHGSVAPPAVVVKGTFTWEHGSKADTIGVGAAPKKPKKSADDDVDEEKLSRKERREREAKAQAKAKEEKAKQKAETDKWNATLKQWSRGIPTTDEVAEKGPEPFVLENVNLTVRKGSFVAIVGRVASGKSSLLQAMTGDMRRTSGEVTFGGTLAYAPQAPWIQNLSMKDNILFGHEFEDQRFRDVLYACALERDIEILPDGIMTEIGERGVTLSGGQKARINLARVAYAKTDIALIDDPLSAVDSHVAKHILEHCLLHGPLSEKTRILVTHQLYVLPYVDEVIYLEDGKVVEQGTYQELVNNGGHFAKLVEEYGAEESQSSEAAVGGHAKDKADDKKDADKPTKLVTGDERETGAVSGAAYVNYAKAAGGIRWALLLMVWLGLAQIAQVASTLFLGFWSGSQIPGFGNGQYMALYAGMGVATAVFTFIAAFAFAQAGFNASLNLFTDALKAVMRAPLSWHEMTPTGAIMNRLSKDIDTLDAMLPQAWFQLLNNGATIVGTIGLVLYSYSWLGIMFPPLIVVYAIFLAFYRRTSIEAKRLDSILRTVLYAGFSEALNGLGTIRAYRAENRFIRDSEKKLDSENRSYFITIVVQRWLAVRMDILSNILVLGIGIIAVGLRTSTNPSNIGIVLTYTLSVTQVMGQTISMLAQVEQNMNTVERIVTYCELEPEPPLEQPTDPPKSEWPSTGAIEFDKVCLRYRPHLPLALNSVSFSVKPGERVGIVGRTGAGKSTILGALFRTGPLESGRILVDGVDLGSLGLATLREALSIIPQDAVLFEGSLRENIDPRGQRKDVELHDALRRVGLVSDQDSKEVTAQGKWDLDRQVRDDSFSAGEKQLLALCRALVRTESKILVLDEATSSVDVATDATIQMMIQQDFRSKTLLCIAHRLNTIVYYDRVLVMDHGEVAEYDTPLNLFDAGGIFRSLCEQASLTRDDIVRIRATAFVKEE
ncbi:multidrug resistance-associated ABC transporter [Exidia glandulosa HHB12029]|uniref:Multidrug resistance-associated ABC transporter n=1 Tax=Exidia glandulosa HHB12029 TaxID=1314781 RepID=A0A165Q208_EXIGL|nr:multidrug resistance-associated ABC transporter [Exidia glandulosa HHB12029]